MQPINFSRQPMNPDVYAQQYAQRAGLSLEEAKTELRSTHGEPSLDSQGPALFSMQSNENISFGQDFNLDDLNNIDFSEFEEASDDMGFDFFKGLLNFFGGFKQESNSQEQLPPMGDPDEYAQQYADENNISLEEAKEELREMYGEPIQAQNPFM